MGVTKGCLRKQVNIPSLTSFKFTATHFIINASALLHAELFK